VARRILAVLGLLVFSSVAPLSAADNIVHLSVDATKPGPKIDRNLFGQFAENLGHGLYEGIWVGPDSSIPNTRGIRNDVVAALRELKVPNVRCATSGPISISPSSRTPKSPLHLSRSNDVICCLAYDPLAVRLPPAEQLVVSNGELQVELQLGEEKVRKGIVEASDKRIRFILAWQHELGIPVLPISTAEGVAQQVRHLLGQVAALRRRV
jgi:hypothetical protein